MTTILFICTANRYRSPIAAACFKRELSQRQLEQAWEVQSAGTWAQEGLPAMPDAIMYARQFGLDIREHRSREVTAQMMEAADLVLVMERDHKEALQLEFQSSRHKLVLLTEVVEGIPNDIDDPVRFAKSDQAVSEICRLIQTGFEKICAAALQGASG